MYRNNIRLISAMTRVLHIHPQLWEHAKIDSLANLQVYYAINAVTILYLIRLYRLHCKRVF